MVASSPYPCRLSFGELLCTLQAAGLGDAEAVYDVLKEHVLALRNAVSSAHSTSPFHKLNNADSKSRKSEKVYLRRTHREGPAPEQGPAERTYAEEVAKRLGISTQRASVLLRDYLEFSDNAAMFNAAGAATLDSDSAGARFQSTAPIEALQKFFLRECKASFACWRLLCTFADDVDHPLCQTSVTFLAANSALGKDLVDRIAVLLRVNLASEHEHAHNSPPLFESEREEHERQLELQWLAEVAVAYFFGRPCEIGALKLLISIVARASTGEIAVHRRTSMLICAVLTEALNLEACSEYFACARRSLESGDATSAMKVLEREFALCEELDRVNEVSSLLDSIDVVLPTEATLAKVAAGTQPLLLMGITRLAWSLYAGCLAATSLLLADERQSLELCSCRQLEAAFAELAFDMLSFGLKNESYDADDGLGNCQSKIFAIFAGFMSTFLAAHPPREELPIAQLDLLCGLVNITFRCAPELARQVWVNENDHVAREFGVGALIRQASAVFPLYMRPLLELLVALVCDAKCASVVCEFLSRGLTTLTTSRSPLIESNLNYPLFEGDARVTRCLDEGAFFFARTLLSCDGSVPVIYAENNVALELRGDVQLPAGSIGLTSSARSDRIVWHFQWNGWRAIFGLMDCLQYVLRASVEIANETEQQNELYVSAELVLNLLENLGSYQTVPKSDEVCVMLRDLIELLACSKSGSLLFATRARLLSSALRSYARLIPTAAVPHQAMATFTLARICSADMVSLEDALYNEDALGSTRGSVPLSLHVAGAMLSIVLDRPVTVPDSLDALREGDVGDRMVSRASEVLVTRLLPVWLANARVKPLWNFLAEAFAVLAQGRGMYMTRDVVYDSMACAIEAACEAPEGSVPLARAIRAALQLLLCALRNANPTHCDDQAREYSRNFVLSCVAPNGILEALTMMGCGCQEKLAFVPTACDFDIHDRAEPIGSKYIEVESCSWYIAASSTCAALILERAADLRIDQLEAFTAGHSNSAMRDAVLRRSIHRRLCQDVFDTSTFGVLKMILSALAYDCQSLCRALFGLVVPPGRSANFAIDGESTATSKRIAEEASVLDAVAHCFRLSFKAISASPADAIAVRGLFLAVRVLCCAWEFHGRVWLIDEWAALRVWDLLMDALKLGIERLDSASREGAHVEDVECAASTSLMTLDGERAAARELAQLPEHISEKNYERRSVDVYWMMICTEILNLMSNESLVQQQLRSETGDGSGTSSSDPRSSLVAWWISPLALNFVPMRLGADTESDKELALKGRLLQESIAATESSSQPSAVSNAVLFETPQRASVDVDATTNYVVNAVRLNAIQAQRCAASTEQMTSQNRMAVQLNLAHAELIALEELSKAFVSSATITCALSLSSASKKGSESVGPPGSFVLSEKSSTSRSECWWALFEQSIGCVTLSIEHKHSLLRKLDAEYSSLAKFLLCAVPPNEWNVAAVLHLGDATNLDKRSVSLVAFVAGTIRRMSTPIGPQGDDGHASESAVADMMMIGSDLVRHLEASVQAKGAQLPSSYPLTKCVADLEDFASVCILAMKCYERSLTIAAGVCEALSAVAIERYKNSMDQVVQLVCAAFRRACELTYHTGTFKSDGSAIDSARMTSSSLAAVANFVVDLAADRFGALCLANAGMLAVLTQLTNVQPDVISPYSCGVESLIWTRSDHHRVHCSVIQAIALILLQSDDTTAATMDSTGSRDASSLAGNDVKKLIITCIRAVKLQPAWPLERVPSIEDQIPEQHITLAQLEAAQSASALLDALTPALLRFPSDTFVVLQALYELVLSAYQLQRAEPIERFVKAVSREEVGISAASQDHLSNFDGTTSSTFARKGSSTTTPQSRGGSRGLNILSTPLSIRGQRRMLSASPSMKLSTPLSPAFHLKFPSGSLKTSSGRLTPLISTATIEPVAQHGSFGYEVHLSVHRVLASALSALRRIHSKVSPSSVTYRAYPELVFPVEPSMALIGDRLATLGLLVAVQLSSLHEMQHAATALKEWSASSGLKASAERLDSEREVLLLQSVQSALQLCVLHTARLIQHNLMPDGVRDELRKRLQSVLGALQRLCPGAEAVRGPQYEELRVFIDAYL